MRARMAEEHRPQSIWDAKHVRGGLVDIEFIVQYLQLRRACNWRCYRRTALGTPACGRRECWPPTLPTI